MPTTAKDEEDHADREVVAKMVKDSRNKSSNFSHHQTEDRNPRYELQSVDNYLAIMRDGVLSNIRKVGTCLISSELRIM